MKSLRLMYWWGALCGPGASEGAQCLVASETLKLFVVRSSEWHRGLGLVLGIERRVNFLGSIIEHSQQIRKTLSNQQQKALSEKAFGCFALGVDLARSVPILCRI